MYIIFLLYLIGVVIHIMILTNPRAIQSIKKDMVEKEGYPETWEPSLLSIFFACMIWPIGLIVQFFNKPKKE